MSGGHSLVVTCPQCSHGFKHCTGTLDPVEGRCPHVWERDTWRGPRGGIACANCGLFIGAESIALAESAPERDRENETREAGKR